MVNTTNHVPCSELDVSMVSGLWKTDKTKDGKEHRSRHTADFDPSNSSVKREDSYKL